MQAFEAAQQKVMEQKKEEKVGAKLQRLQEEKVALLCSLCCLDLNSFMHSLHAFQSADQVRCSRHSMAALQPALSWGFLHHVIESSGPQYCLTDAAS